MVYLTYKDVYPLLDKINFHCYEQESFVLLSAFYNLTSTTKTAVKESGQ